MSVSNAARPFVTGNGWGLATGSNSLSLMKAERAYMHREHNRPHPFVNAEPQAAAAQGENGGLTPGPQVNKDTLYRIHGTNEPWTIGQNVSSGCIRLTNDDIVDLYNRTPISTKVVVLATAISSDTAKPIGPQGVTGSHYQTSGGADVIASQQR
jgi:L,D-transpeptidase catalytic domain